MAANAASNSAVIAGRSHTSTRPASSCRVSSASNPGHSGPLGAAEAGGDHRSRRPTPLPRPMPTPRPTPARNPTPHRHHNLAATPLTRHHIRATHIPALTAHATVHPEHLPLTVPTTIP